jgi:hypothetical protein
MSMILALNGVPMDDFGDFGEFGAASASVVGLQTALANFGRQIGDAALKAIVADGLIGPKTTAAANRAMRQHIGAGQAPQDLRTGVLTQAQVVANAAQLTTLINTEARRRGFGIATAPATVKKPVAKAKAPAAAVTYIPPAASKPSAAAQAWPTYGPPMPAAAPAQVTVPTSRTYVVPNSGGMDVESVVKWSAIGLGVVALLGGAYYVVQKRRGQPVMAGFEDDEFGAAKRRRPPSLREGYALKLSERARNADTPELHRKAAKALRAAAHIPKRYGWGTLFIAGAKDHEKRAQELERRG